MFPGAPPGTRTPNPRIKRLKFTHSRYNSLGPWLALEAPNKLARVDANWWTAPWTASPQWTKHDGGPEPARLPSGDPECARVRDDRDSHETALPEVDRSVRVEASAPLRERIERAVRLPRSTLRRLRLGNRGLRSRGWRLYVWRRPNDARSILLRPGQCPPLVRRSEVDGSRARSTADASSGQVRVRQRGEFRRTSCGAGRRIWMVTGPITVVRKSHEWPVDLGCRQMWAAAEIHGRCSSG